MGFRYSYNIDIAATEIRKAKFECTSSYNDGYIQWGVKQDLYQLKWLLDSVLADCPHFGSNEDEWLKNQEQNRIIKILKDKP